MTSSLIVIAFALSACSGGSSSSSSGDRAQPVPNIDLKSCTYNASEGQSVDMQSLDIETLSVASFGKKFNRALLEAVGHASVNETVKFINMTDVTVYQAPAIQTTACSQELFANAEVLPQDLSQEWDEATTDTDGSKSILLGLYLPENSKGGTLPSILQQAAIIVSKNVSRWTLIHEFMHHLFMLQSRSEGYNSDKSFSDWQNSINAYNASLDDNSLPRADQVKKSVELYVKVAQGADEHTVHYALEEMAIEKELKDATKSGVISFAPPSSNWYLNKSSEKAIGRYNTTIKIATYLRSEAEKLGLSQHVEMMKDVISHCYIRISEINQITYQYPHSSKNLLAGIQGISAVEGEHVGCSHSKRDREIDEAFGKIKVLTKK